jgi:hypothetical protein
MTETRIGLKNEYVRINCGNEWWSNSMHSNCSYGGNQGWFGDEDKHLRPMGCGLISCADILLYKSGRRELGKQEYMDYVRSLNKGPLTVRKHLGVNGLSLAKGIRRKFREMGVAAKVSWCFSKSKILPRITAMLEADTPVTISVGPHLGKTRLGVNFYVRDSKGSFVLPDWRSGLVRDHYVTVTGMVRQDEDLWLEISSWGEKYYISWQEYMNYLSLWKTFFSNIMLIIPK